MRNTSTHWHRQWVFGEDLKGTVNKTKNRQRELYQSEKILAAKEIIITLKRQQADERKYLHTAGLIKDSHSECIRCSRN